VGAQERCTLRVVKWVCEVKEVPMSPLDVPVCQCPRCQAGAEHPDRVLHQRMNLFLSRLDEAQRRWYVALESSRIGYGGDALLAQITGMDEKTIRRGREELAGSLHNFPPERVRRPGGGRPAIEKKTRR
jgi:hypothetical protein